ncbi:MAG: D-2-hydroxyacid dehydrogenase family protein, partial [Chloroflexi bacterium]|nr:D-2-hydroxyacid dehydrogenase family protein [Chloroflexota bacterium]
MTRIAVIDDYQSVAHRMADWDSLPDSTTVDFYQDHLSDHDALVERLKDYEIVQLMRERTPFQAQLLDALPKL